MGGDRANERVPRRRIRSEKGVTLEENEEEEEGLWAERSSHNVAWPLAYNVDAT